MVQWVHLDKYDKTFRNQLISPDLKYNSDSAACRNGGGKKRGRESGAEGTECDSRALLAGIFRWKEAWLARHPEMRNVGERNIWKETELMWCAPDITIPVLDRTLKVRRLTHSGWGHLLVLYSIWTGMPFGYSKITKMWCWYVNI